MLSNVFRYTLSPLLLITFCPAIIVIFNYLSQHLNGSDVLLFNAVKQDGFYVFFIEKCVISNFPTITHFIGILAFYMIQITLFHIVPGKVAHGPATPTGYVPKYKENGVLCYLLSLCLTVITHFYSGIKIIDHLTPLIIAICIMSWIVTFLLFLSALLRPENPKDVVWSGNPIYDYYRGWELYPYCFGINLKQLINSRIGMTQWAAICLCHVLTDYDNMSSRVDTDFDLSLLLRSPVFISGILQMIYLFKFFWWEVGYFNTLDVMHDRCGFYISWGCLSWVFSVYTFHTAVLLSHKLMVTEQTNNIESFSMTPFNAIAIFVIGVLSIYINYAADYQKMYVRKANGNCNVYFGQKAQVIRANYKTKDGKNKKSILLVNGYWGIARHFHYIPELMFALMICVPTMYASRLQYFYFVYLVILLTDRCGRDDQRCSDKYGQYWAQYKKKVPYKMLPYVW